MTPDLTLALRQSACRRAHIYGAEAVILEKEAAALLHRADLARRRYHRELATVNLLGGHPAPFTHLC